MSNSNAAADNTSPHKSLFSFATWVRLFAPDLIVMACMGALGLGIYEAPPVPNRSFPVVFQDGNVVYPDFAYPLRKEIVPIWLAAFIAFFAPFVFFVLFQIRRRSLFDLATTTLGLLRSLITAAVFQVWIKWLIGGLRPHFLAVCQPNVPISGTQSGGGFAAIMYDRSVCTGDKDTIDDSLESFPSGHSTAGFAGLMYLALYFNAQLKVISAHNSAYWTMVLFFTPILGATLIAGALTIDEFHNWYDVLAGAIIGTATALVAFRQTFASIWDFRFNHILLPRTSSWFLRSPVANFGPQFFTYQWQNSGAVALDAYRPFTREGGWGTMSEEHVGAPFDALVDNAATGGARGNPNGNLDPLSRAEAGRRTRM